MVLNLLKLSLKKSLKTKRGLSLQMRRDIRDFIRFLESPELAEDEKKVKESIDTGLVELIKSNLKEWMKDIDKHLKKVLDAEIDTVVEEKKLLKIKINPKLGKELEKLLQKSKSLKNSEKSRSLLNRLKVLNAKLEKLDEEIIATIRKEVVVMRDQISDETHVNDLLIKINTTQTASDAAWEVNSDVKITSKDVDKIEDTEKEEIKTLKSNKLTEEQLKGLEKQEKELEQEITKLEEDFRAALQHFLYLTKFLTHFYLVFTKKQEGKIGQVINYLEGKKFPPEQLEDLKKFKEDMDKDVNEVSSKIYNAFIRLRNKQPKLQKLIAA